MRTAKFLALCAACLIVPFFTLLTVESRRHSGGVMRLLRHLPEVLQVATSAAVAVSDVSVPAGQPKKMAVARAARPAPEKKEQPEAAPRPPTFQEMEDLILSDPSRLYIDFRKTVGDLTWGVLAVSDKYGISVWVSNPRDSKKTYFAPKLCFLQNCAIWRWGAVGGVLSPGQRYSGVILAPGLKGVPRIQLTASAAGADDASLEVKLDWR